MYSFKLSTYFMFSLVPGNKWLKPPFRFTYYGFSPQSNTSGEVTPASLAPSRTSALYLLLFLSLHLSVFSSINRIFWWVSLLYLFDSSLSVYQWLLFFRCLRKFFIELPFLFGFLYIIFLSSLLFRVFEKNSWMTKFIFILNQRADLFS